MDKFARQTIRTELPKYDVGPREKGDCKYMGIISRTQTKAGWFLCKFPDAVRKTVRHSECATCPNYVSMWTKGVWDTLGKFKPFSREGNDVAP